MGLTKSCSECGELGHYPKGYDAFENPTIHEWYKLTTLALSYRVKNEGDISPDNFIYINNDKDNVLIDETYDFCSEKCALRWFKKELEKIRG